MSVLAKAANGTRAASVSALKSEGHSERNSISADNGAPLGATSLK